MVGGAFVALAAVSTAGVFFIRRWAVRNFVLDHPNERSSHSTPTPRGGGLAIVTITTIAAAYAALPSPELLVVVFAALAVAVTGVIDDIRSLPSSVRLIVHLVAALIVVLQGWRLPFGVAAVPITVLWISGLTNSYNFMDGIDGIAGTQAVCAALGWIAFGVAHHDRFILVVAFAIAASSAGFLQQNWPPARIFMGDVGSGYLGFVFGSLAAIAAREEPRAALGGALMVWPFLFDSLFTFARRVRNRENVFQAHRSHLYQRMVIAGASHATVTTRYGVAMALCAAGAVVTMTTAVRWIGIAVALATAIYLLMTTWRAEKR